MMAPVIQQLQSGESTDIAGNACKISNVESKKLRGREAARSDKEKKNEAQRQAWFENTVKEKLNIPTTYEEAFVSIIRWNPDIDGFKDGHDDEIKDLKDVFTRRFHFSIASEVQLNTHKKPQGTLNHAITELIALHDGPNKLLIIYYTGHGMLVGPSGDQDLELTATDDFQKNHQGTYPATACWAKAEAPLLDSTEADVLVILDCCYASNAHKGHSESSRIYELLAACPKGEMTPAPGESSFTRRLIKTLHSILDEQKDQRILTTKLLTTLNKKSKIPAGLHDQLNKIDVRHVQLTPIDKQSKDNGKKEHAARPPELAGVKLRFSLRERELDKDKIEKWAQELLKACDAAGVSIRQIDWIKMTKMECRDAKDVFRQAVKTMIRDHRRRSLTCEGIHEGTALLSGKRPHSEDDLSSPAKRHAHDNVSILEPQELSGLLTPQDASE